MTRFCDGSRLSGVRRSCFFLVLGIALLSGVAGAGEKIETDSLSITLPQGWKPNLKSNPISAAGPSGELLQLTLKTAAGGENPSEAAQILSEAEQKVATIMQQITADQKYVTVTPFKGSTLVNGASFQEIVSQTKDGKQVLAQFSLRGSQSFFFATYEAAVSPQKSLPDIRQALIQTTLKSSSASSSPAPSAPAAKDRKVNVYLIPLNDFSVEAPAQLAKQLSREFNIWVKSTLPLGTKKLQPMPETNQYAAEDIIAAAQTLISRLPELGPDTTYVLLTNRDINSRARNFRFMFSFHDKGPRVSVVSTARMRFNADGSPRTDEKVFANFTKMTKRAIGEMYFGWDRSTDLSDLMYAPIMGLDDLDNIGNRHP